LRNRGKMKNKDKIVLPGTFIGTEEEYLPGKGTYVDEFGIHSSVLGFLHIDKKRHATVIPFNEPPDLKVGSVVFGKIEEILDAVAFVSLEEEESISRSFDVSKKTRKRTFTLNGVIPVSEISKNYVKRIRDVLRVGDIVKGIIIKITPFRIEMSLKGKDFGVIKAFCTRCRTPLKRKGRMLECPKCKNKERRKLSFQYRFI